LECKELFKNIVFEFSKTIDDTLLPETTISSLGLKIASQLQWRIQSAMSSQNKELKHAAFINAVNNLLRSEFDYALSPEIIEKERIRFKVKSCPFKEGNSPSLCSIMGGIMGGLGFLTFGYSKIVRISGPDQEQAPCVFDLYVIPSEDNDIRIGIEYSKASITLLKGGDEKYIDKQRQTRRKLILGLFSSLAYSLRENPSVNRLANKFIESLSCIPEIRIAGLYLKDATSGRFVLQSQYGIPKKFIPLIDIISAEEATKDPGDTGLIKLVEDFNGQRLAIAKALSARSFASIKIETKDNISGILNIGWKSTFPVSTETIESIKASSVLLATAIENSRLYNDLEKIYISSCTLLNNLVNTVDQFSNDHSLRVAELAKDIAEEMGLPQDEIIRLHDAGRIHDIGKINIPASILNKPDKLTEEEFKLVKEHPVTGARLLEPISSLQKIIPAIKYHHERMDGSGYPEGLMGDEIPLHARILAVADVYDAMTHSRSYHNPKSKMDALQEIIDKSGTKYDPAVVGALVSVVSNEDQMAPDELSKEELLF